MFQKVVKNLMFYIGMNTWPCVGGAQAQHKDPVQHNLSSAWIQFSANLPFSKKILKQKLHTVSQQWINSILISSEKILCVSTSLINKVEV